MADPFQDIVTRLKSRTYSTNKDGSIRSGFTANTLETRRKLAHQKKLNITAKDLENQFEIQNGLDYWTGLPLNLFAMYDSLKWNPSRVSVDRIDGEGDYTPDNILLTTRMMNCARNSYPPEKFRVLVGYLMGKNDLVYSNADWDFGKRNIYAKMFSILKNNINWRVRAEFGSISSINYLTIEDIGDLIQKQNNRCHYFNTDLNFGLLYTDHPEYFPRNPLAPSLDRIDCSKPYTTDNVVLCMRFANAGRAACPYDEFLEYVARTFKLSNARPRPVTNTLEVFFDG